MPEKRKFDGGSGEGKAKKILWQHDPSNHLTPFAVGIFLTVVRGKEAVATRDALAMFNDYAERHNLKSTETDAQSDDSADEDVSGEVDIEKAIEAELEAMRSKKKTDKKPYLFTPLKTLTECVIFIRTAKSLDPVDIVHGICSEAKADPTRKLGGRFIKRMTPISVSSDASLTGLKFCLDRLLPTTFQGQSLRYKIEPTFRNHNVLNRDTVIPEVAAAISKTGTHTVDLKNYDALVMIEVIRGFLGVSVVRDWEKYRKYNLAEIYIDALPAKDKEDKKAVVESKQSRTEQSS